MRGLNLDHLVGEIRDHANELEKTSRVEEAPVVLKSGLGFTQDMLKLAQELRGMDPGAVTLEDVREFANDLLESRNG